MVARLAGLARCCAGNTLYNSITLLGGDGTRGLHRKLVPTHSERLIWGQGDGSTLAAWPRDDGVLRALVCWMPLAHAAMHAQHEAIHVAQWPAVHERHQLASRAYAFEGQCHAIAAGCVLTRDDLIDRFDSAGGDRIARSLLKSMPAEKSILKDGGSAAISPDARYILAPAGLTRDVLFVEIDLTRCDHATFYLDTHGHYARPDVFERRVNTRCNPGVRLSDTQDQ